MNAPSSLSKENLFSHAIDASYHNTELHDNDYYSYEGVNLKDVDRMIDKYINEEISDDLSTNCQLSECDFRRFSSNFDMETRKFSSYLASSWLENLKKLKKVRLSCFLFQESLKSPAKYEMKLSFDNSIPSLHLDN